MAYATAQDVLARWIATTLPPAQEVIEGYLEDATVLIDAEFPDLAERAILDEATAARAALVARRMVMRVLTNPDQLRSTSEATGPFSSGATYAAETLGGLYLSDEDRALLSAVPTRTQQAYAIDPTPTGNDRASHRLLYTSQVAGWPETGDDD